MQALSIHRVTWVPGASEATTPSTLGQVSCIHLSAGPGQVSARGQSPCSQLSAWKERPELWRI